jgi:hypothetical protein
MRKVKFVDDYCAQRVMTEQEKNLLAFGVHRVVHLKMKQKAAEVDLGANGLIIQAEIWRKCRVMEEKGGQQKRNH